jgi:hypothetical protein
MSWLSWLVSVSVAATLEVGPDSAFRNLDDAILVALPGDTILVQPGTYPGPIRLGEKELEIVSAGGSAVTALVPADVTYYIPPVIEIRGAEPVTLRGFTVDADHQTVGMVVVEGDVFAEDLVFRGGPYSPAHLYADTSSLTMLDSAFEAEIGATGQHAQVRASVVDFERVSFRKGQAFYGGGAINLDRSDGTFRDCVFADNRAEDGGGAVFSYAADGNTVVFEDCLFERNEAWRWGGAVLQEGGTLLMTRTTMRDNVAHDGSGALDHSWGTLLRFEDGLVQGNHTPGDTAGIGTYYQLETIVTGTRFEDNVAGGSGGALTVWGTSTLADLAGNTFCANVAGERGGAVWLDSYDMLTASVHHNVFVGNEAELSGAAVGVYASAAELSHNTIVDSVTHGDAGAVWMGARSQVSLIDNAFVGSVGSAAYQEPDALQGEVRYNLLYANDRGLTGMPNSTVVDGDPAFVSHVPGDCASDLRPGPGSALVDAGDPALQDDDGSPADIGAYGGPGASTLVDLDGDGAIEDDCDVYDPLAGVRTDEIAGDGLDQDCDGLDLCYVDSDGDGAGSEQTTTGPLGCAQDGLAPTAGDCDDTDPERLSDCAVAPSDVPPPPSKASEALPPPWFCAHAPAGGWGLWPLLLALGATRLKSAGVSGPRTFPAFARHPLAQIARSEPPR